MASFQNPSQWWVAFGVGLSLAVVFASQTGFAIVLAPRQRALNISPTLTPWILNSYLLTLSAGILLGSK